MLYLKSCKKCGGDMYQERDTYGHFRQCLQCGLVQDLDAKPALPVQKPAAKAVGAPKIAVA
jgi:DNA-directed RNA polymerase subunit M/transcription elongation factor TFIIS